MSALAGMTTLTTEISDALTRGRQGCPLCSLWSSEEESILEGVRMEDGSGASMLEGLQTSSGFCNRHTHAVHKGGTSGGDSLGCPSCARVVLKKFERDLEPVLSRLKSEKAPTELRRTKGEELLTETISKLEDSISGTVACPVCERLSETDRDRVASLVQMLESKEYSELYAKSDALCMPHFVSTMQTLPRSSIKDIEGVWSFLVRTQLARLESVDHLLNERMKKYSWDYRDEGITPEEANAQKAAMLAIAGVEGLYSRSRKTSLRPARVWY